MASSEFDFTLPEVEKDILRHYHLLASSHRSDPHRPTLLRKLAQLRTMRNALSPQKIDLDKCIIHVTEAILLPSQPSQDVVHMFFRLASVLLSRFSFYEQPEDVKSSVEYFRFLRINFHPLEAFDIPRGEFTSHFIQALGHKLKLGFGDMTQDMEEMAALAHELLCLGVSTSDRIRDIVRFSSTVINTVHLDASKQPPERVIQVLREATVLIPDSHDVSCALAWCLVARFQETCVIKDYEEAMTIADKIVAAIPHGDTLTPTQANAIWVIVHLAVWRFNSYANPENLEESIHRLCALLRIPPLSDAHRAVIDGTLDNLVHQRSNYFSVTGNSEKTLFDDPGRIFLLSRREASSRLKEQASLMNEIRAAIRDGEITDVGVAVERGRSLLPPPHSSHPFSYSLVIDFADILFRAYQHTGQADFLNEAITTFRDLRKAPTPKLVHCRAGDQLLRSLVERHNLFDRGRDFEETMQLYPELANDRSTEVFRRFKISLAWARYALIYGHHSISTAYETAVSLMQETIVFSPTLHIQHFRLADALRDVGVFPLEYASYQINVGQYKQAVETLERGRALLWSEMRGLRTSTDRLQAAALALAEELEAINRKLELVTMYPDSEAGTGRHEGMDSIGRLAATQQKLLDERNSVISRIQSFPGLEDFLKRPLFDALNSAAAHGPVIIINQSQWRSYIIILHKDLSPHVISTPSDFHDRANRLNNQLLRVRKEKGLDSKDYDLTLASVLADLYDLVGRPVIERLRQLDVPEKSRVWWCPTSAFCSLPLHAMGPIPSDGGDNVYFMDLYIPSYTPTLSALIESRKPGLHPKVFDKPSLLLAAQPETLPGGWGEINVVKAVGPQVTTLVSEEATPTTVVASLRDHRFVHFVCHGLLETGKPFGASFELHGDNLTLLEIVRSQLPAAEFAFLSACHTAELTEDSVADEGLHLTAAMQFCGFRSVIGTMWAMADTDGEDLSRHFYKSIFSESKGQRRVPHYERSARALQFAVKKLRKKRGITLERWVNFVHYGA